MKQDMKKWSAIIATLFLVFGVMVTSAMADTSTVSGALYFDKTTVKGGETINLSLLGLDANGGVDIYGEQFGSTIMGVVTSQLGTVNSGGTSGASPATGSFNASVKYITCSQGVGKGNLSYDSNVSGTDTVTVSLQEKFDNEQGGTTYRVIDSFTQTIVVNKKSVAANKIRVTSFTAPSSDTQGADDSSTTGGIDGTMTVGTAGGQVKIEALDSSNNTDLNANGTITVTLYPAATAVTGNKAKTTYTYSITMTNGVGFLTFDDGVKEAGTYYIKAETTGFSAAMNSVQFSTDDTLTLKPKTENKKLLLTSQKTIISDDGNSNSGTDIKAYVLDEFGNKTAASAAHSLKFTDANGIFSSSAASLSFASGGAESNTATLGDSDGDYSSKKTGTASVYVAIDGTSSIASSTPVDIKIVSKNLAGQVDSTWTTPQKAGNAFQAFDLAVDYGTANTNGTGSYTAPNNTTSTYLSTSGSTAVNILHYVDGSLKESVTSNITKSTVDIETLFTKSSGTTAPTTETYVIGDASGEYGQVVITPTVAKPQITAGSATTGSVVNGHKETTTIWPMSASGTNYAGTIDQSQVLLMDSYNNSLASADSGDVTISSSDGTISGTNPLTPNGASGTTATITYDPTKFTGEDTPKFTFSKAGVSSLLLSATVPAKKALTTLVINSVAGSDNALAASTVTLPLNAEIPVTMEALNQSGSYIDDKTVTINVSGTVNPTVNDCTGVPLASGQLLDFSAATTGTDGRHVTTVIAPNQLGSFTITLKNAAGTVTVSQEFVVTNNVTPTEDVGKNEGIIEVEEAADTVVNLYVNTTNPDGEAAVYEWFVFTATLAGDAAQLPLYLLPTDGPIVAIEEGIDIYDYTLDYADTDVAFIAALTMADLGLSTGDVFAYAYAYQNEGGDIYLPNVVFITVK